MASISDTDGRQTMPPTLHGAIAVLAGRQHGVISIAQLEGIGLSARAAQHRSARGYLHRIHRGVYSVGHRALTADGARMAAVLACGESACLSHHSAAALWGMRVSERVRTDVTVRGRGRHESMAGVLVHTTRRTAAEEFTRYRGIPVTTVARTLVDLAGSLDADRIGRVVHEAEVLRLLDVRALDEALAGAGGCAGAGRLRRAVAEPSPGVTRSELENRFMTLCRDSGLSAPRTNVTLKLRARAVEVDALWPAARLIVELDGTAVHRTRRAFHADRRRDLELAAEGYVVVRLTWERVTRDAGTVMSELRRVLALRGGIS